MRVPNKHLKKFQNPFDPLTERTDHRLFCLCCLLTFVEMALEGTGYEGNPQAFIDSLTIDPKKREGYLAGFKDADGCVCVHKSHIFRINLNGTVRRYPAYQATVEFCNSELLDLLGICKFIGLTYEQALRRIYYSLYPDQENACIVFSVKFGARKDIVALNQQFGETLIGKNTRTLELAEFLTTQPARIPAEAWEVMYRKMRHSNRRGLKARSRN